VVWIHPKTARTASSTTGALVGAGSLWPVRERPRMVQGKRESGCGRLQQQLAVVPVAAGRLFFSLE